VLYQPRPSLFGGASALTFAGPGILQTELQVIESEPVRAEVRKRLNGVAPPATARAIGQTSVIEVAVESTVPQSAVVATKAYVDSFIEYDRKQALDSLTAASTEVQTKIADLQKEIDALTARLGEIPPCVGVNPPPSCTQRQNVQQDRDAALTQQAPLKQRLNQLQVDASFANGGPQLISSPVVPTTPVRPRPVRNAGLGLGLGLVLAIALAFMLEHLDASIKSKEDLERAARDLPVLGLIPAVAVWKDKGETRVVSLSEPSSPSAEAYRALRTSINFVSMDQSIRVLQVTSPSASDGKTTTVANLAIALARAGQQVVAVSCDLRRPRLHQFFGLDNTVGFTSVLLGEAPLASALADVPNEPRLKLLPSGPIPPNPSELLSSRRVKAVLAAITAQADIVVIDSAPVLPVTDATVLSSAVDGVLVVATAGTTTSKEIARTVELLRQVDARLVGTVLNNVPSEAGYGYKYGYYTAGPSSNGRKSTPPREEEVAPRS
jgi:non-specific protein-tyrosine kinase